MSCLWGWMNVGMNMDVWVRGRWRDLGRMEDGTTWKVSGQQHDDEQAWTDCIMIHFLRYPKGLGGTETKVRKCSNSNCPQLALTSRLHRCQFWNSWDDQQAASGARPTVQDHDWAAGCSSWWPPSSNPPCRATLGVALGSVTREALPCNMFPDWRGGGGIMPIHECLRSLHCTLLEEKNASWCTCCAVSSLQHLLFSKMYIVQAAKIRAGSRLTSPWKVPLLAIVVPGKGKEEEESLFTAKPVFLSLFCNQNPNFMMHLKYCVGISLI